VACGFFAAMLAAGLKPSLADPGETSMVTSSALLATDRTLVIAHRGNSSQAPENTLPAFVSAIDAGADLIELDYYHSSDEVPVVFHDKELDRTTNARELLGREKIRLDSLPLTQLRRLDAGSWFDARYQGARIPTLDEALDTIQSGSTTLVERKAGDAATCVKLLRQKRLLDHVIVQAFDWAYLRDCHRLAPDLVLGALGSEQLTQARLAEIEASGAKIVGWKQQDLRSEDIRAIHERGLKAWVYTVNEPETALRLVEMGIDGIITDDPSRLLRTLRPQR
jgi:glycerophosphoryl diester phosphodiesterase